MTTFEEDGEHSYAFCGGQYRMRCVTYEALNAWARAKEFEADDPRTIYDHYKSELEAVIEDKIRREEVDGSIVVRIKDHNLE